MPNWSRAAQGTRVEEEPEHPKEERTRLFLIQNRFQQANSLDPHQKTLGSESEIQTHRGVPGEPKSQTELLDPSGEEDQAF